MQRLLIVSVVLAFLAVPTAAASPIKAPPLKRYLSRVNARITVYRQVLVRVEQAVAEESQVNVDPVVEKFYALADDFEDLDVSWETIGAPRGLRVRHRAMGRAFVLFADAYRIHAAALFTRHPDEILAARPKVEARIRSAAYLQYRWAAALQGALRRADLKVPGWLHGMAALKP